MSCTAFYHHLAFDSGTACPVGLRIKWVMSLEIDASRAQNRLSLINDCANVPGYDNQPNVVWLECEDR